MPAKDPVTGKFVSSAAAAGTAPKPDVPTGDEITPAPDAGAEKPKGKEADLDLSGAQALVESFLGDKPTVLPEKKKAKTDKPKTDDAGKEKTDGKPAAKPDVPAKPAAAKSKPSPPAPPLTAEQIAAAAAEGVARAFPKPEKKDSPQDTKPDESWMTDTDKRRVAVLQQMEKLYPERYKGIAEKYATSKKGLINYAKKWEAEHPGEEFDETAEEHAEFLDSNDIDWEDEDYLEAAAELKASAKIAESQKTTDQKLSSIERKEKLREAQPLIFSEVGKAAHGYWKLMGETFAGIVDENGNFDPAKAKAIADADPVTFGIRLEAAKALDAEVAELYKLMGVPGLKDDAGNPAEYGLVEFDPKNPIHANLDKFANEQEQAMKRLPEADQRDSEGRSFLPYADYYKLNPKQRAAFWTFTATDLAMLRAKNLAETAQKIITTEEDKYRQWAKARGINIETESGKHKQDADPEPAEETVGAVEKPASPSGSIESKLAASKTGSSPQPTSGAKAFVLRSF